MSSPANRAATIRKHELLMWGDTSTAQKRASSKEFDAALAALVTQAEGYDVILNKWETQLNRAVAAEQHKRDAAKINAELVILHKNAEARADQLQRERDTAERCETSLKLMLAATVERAERAEIALRHILVTAEGEADADLVAFARAALADSGETT